MTRTLGKKRAEWLGRVAESCAAFFLTLKGYRTVAKRWRCFCGEIDLIVVKGRMICFVEVKYRQEIDTALHAVGPHDQKRIEDAADIYIANLPQPHYWDMRFDMIACAPGRIVHIRDAWRPTG